eukprot:jgi/Tetstr1/431848/TSEL_021339.t1
MSLQPARVRPPPADMVTFAEVAAAWLAKARAVVAGRQASRARYSPPPTRPSPVGDGVGWGAVDHLSDVDMVHMPAEMSMETAVPIDFQEAWAEAQRCVNERVVVAVVEADDPVVLDKALKWKYMLPQLLLKARGRGARAAAATSLGVALPRIRRAAHDRTRRLPGWFNRLFASTRLMAHVKKLGEGGAPDVRPVAVGEAERRAAERAVVDNMKHAYVPMLALSQLGVGISAGNSRLIHGHVWPALHAFRTSIKAPVGLEVRFDKMHAYNAGMEAAWREAPADIKWPELDGHHGIPVLNVPLGWQGYVHAYMRGKAEELREEVDASLSKLLSAKPSRRYTHAMNHHAWAMLKHCMPHRAGYWLRNCLPPESTLPEFKTMRYGVKYTAEPRATAVDRF